MDNKGRITVDYLKKIAKEIPHGDILNDEVFNIVADEASKGFDGLEERVFKKVEAANIFQDKAVVLLFMGGVAIGGLITAIMN